MMNGIEIQKLPWDNLKSVGVLQFKEYPSTIIYSDKKGNPYIVEWVDLDEKTNTDIYFIYQTSVDNLKRYIDKIISHYDLMTTPEGGIVLKYYGELASAKSFMIISAESIPLKLLPTQGSFFNTKYSDDLDKINLCFNFLKHL